MWTNISATTKVVQSRDQTPRKCDNQSKTNSSPNSSQFDSVLGRIDVQSSKNCGSPLMRYKHAVCSAQDGFIYVHGGRFGNLPLDDDVWRFDLDQNSWSKLVTSGNRPPSLQEHTLVEYQQHLYLFGGQVSAASMKNCFWDLDLAKREWQSLDMKCTKDYGVYLGPVNRRGHSAIVFGDSMYVFGGFEDFRGSSNQLWEYQFKADRWLLRNLSSTSSCQPEARHSHSAIIYKDSMYIYGGLSDLKSLGDLWRWSWSDKRWFKEKTRGSSPGQLHGHTAIQAFNSMFVFGGERSDGRPTEALWRLNLSNMTWQKIRPKGPKPSPTTWHRAVANPLNKLHDRYIIEGDEESPDLTADSSISLSEVRRTCSSDAEFKKLAKLERKAEAMQVASRSSTTKNHERSKRLRLSFLRRRMRSKSQGSELSRFCSSEPVETIFVAQTANKGVQEVNGSKPETPSEQKGNSNKLDDLDTELKQMFELADIVKPETSTNTVIGRETTSELSAALSSQFVTANSFAGSDLVSQRTSFAAYATPPSELASNYTRPTTSRSNKRDRPKSEIVQLLIDQADAQIKHHNTPLFDNHHSGGQLEQRRQKFARTKRHTIHQTMTYYNLYFSEDKSNSNSSGEDKSRTNPIDKQVELDGLSRYMTRDDLSYTSTLKGGSAGTLVGGHNQSSSPISLLRNQDLPSELSFEEASQKTLCPDSDQPNSVISLHSALTSRGLADSDQPMIEDSPIRAESVVDNTSLSFSVIAEFEEDDMLQFSSPTEPLTLAKQTARDNRQTVIFAGTSSRDQTSGYNSTLNSLPKFVSNSRNSVGLDQASKLSQPAPPSSPLENGREESSSLRTDSDLGFNSADTASPERKLSFSKKINSHPDIGMTHKSGNQTCPMVVDSTITSSSVTADSLLMPSDDSIAFEISSPKAVQLVPREEKILEQPAGIEARRTTSGSGFFGRKKLKKRYWQLCMFVIGGKQGGSHGHNEPINVWRLYI